MSEVIDISGLEKAAVLMALFNASRQQGMGFMDASGRGQMTIEDARDVIAGREASATDWHRSKGRVYDWDYLRGRVMKVCIDGDAFDPWLFDRDNGKGAAKRAIDAIREGGDK